ncbi:MULTISPECIES: N-acetyltransferase [Pseudomonas]|uniref:N-acetyltransferase n=1 Tax=Pseudomonas wuhanensis TaxID=2954098 RepID=A0ABY9GKM3_9PSED|nr:MULTISPECIES: N-acetyltransferase [unclassified Pseudomonas]WLI10481.1 N-acetyltransferase [Pseudomonas sp. FP603]WLI16294.1 N-acetyltransferase [Pseudomonas sp. FP607]
MSAIAKLRERIKQKGLLHTLQTLWKRYVYFHRELLWLGRDLVTPVAPHNLRPYTGLHLETITPENAKAFTKYYGNRVKAMAEIAAEGHTGHMYVDEQGDAIGFIWGSKGDYFDRHYYGCWFRVNPGEFFEFGGEMIPQYFGSNLSVDAQFNLWNAMRAKGYNKIVDVCDTRNIQAMKMHIRMDYQEQGRITHVYDLFGRWRFFRETYYNGSRLTALRKPAQSAVTAAQA